MLYMLNSRIRHRAAGPKAKNATIPTFNQTMTEMVFERPTIKSTSTFGAMGVHHGTDSSRSVCSFPLVYASSRVLIHNAIGRGTSSVGRHCDEPGTIVNITKHPPRD